MGDNGPRSGGTVHPLPDRDLVELAYICALDAMSASELYETMTRVDNAGAPTRRSFDAIVRDVRETMAVASSATGTAAPVELRSRILDAVDATHQELSPPSVPSLDAHRAKRNRWRVAAAAAAAVVIVGVGGAVVTTQLGDSAAPTQVQAADARTVSVDMTGGGTATVSYSRSENTGSVTFEGMAPPPDGSVYELWLVDGVSRSVGMIGPGDPLTHTLNGIGSATTFAVTVEPTGGSQLPTTAAIAQVSLQA
ncbi:anti-sigma-K factor RskA [Rhodococcoides trifolii]|uniref:Regulator of SigK n=2 Tax=Rhodococcoides trifolii TaxID=908250 RepID=A0A917G5N9_9NOCA|nr:anti-sigma-K factor RskA [Rhodococcus trifolii]